MSLGLGLHYGLATFLLGVEWIRKRMTFGTLAPSDTCPNNRPSDERQHHRRHGEQRPSFGQACANDMFSKLWQQLAFIVAVQHALVQRIDQPGITPVAGQFVDSQGQQGPFSNERTAPQRAWRRRNCASGIFRGRV